MTYGDSTYGGAPYAGSAAAPTAPLAPQPSSDSSIELVDEWSPVDYQISSGTALTVWLPPDAWEYDAHVLQVAMRGGASATPSDPAWVRQHRVSSGSTDEDIAEELWTRIILPNETPPSSVTFTFSKDAGEKWVGGQSLRYADISALVSAVDGVTGGESLILEALRGFIYSYSEILQALARPEPGFGYSRSHLLQRLVTKDGFGYSVSHLVQRLISKNGFGYSYLELLDPNTKPDVVQHIASSHGHLTSGGLTGPSVSIPTSVQPGDLLIAGSFTAPRFSLVIPDGWNALYHDEYNGDPFSGLTRRGSLIWRWCPDPPPTSLSFEYTEAWPEFSGAWHQSLSVSAFRNVDLGAPFAGHQKVNPTSAGGVTDLPGHSHSPGGRRVVMSHVQGSATGTANNSTDPEPWNIRFSNSGVSSQSWRLIADALHELRPHGEHLSLAHSLGARFAFDLIVRVAP